MKLFKDVGLESDWREELSWKASALRFVLGGAITLITGLIAARFGPVLGGLFLAFPAILPAGVTLIEQHDGQKAAGASARPTRLAGTAHGTGRLAARRGRRLGHLRRR